MVTYPAIDDRRQWTLNDGHKRGGVANDEQSFLFFWHRFTSHVRFFVSFSTAATATVRVRRETLSLSNGPAGFSFLFTNLERVVSYIEGEEEWCSIKGITEKFESFVVLRSFAEEGVGPRCVHLCALTSLV